MALATGDIYLTGQQAAEKTIQQEQLRKDQEAAEAARQERREQIRKKLEQLSKDNEALRAAQQERHEQILKLNKQIRP